MVAQQASYIRHLTDLSVGEYTSGDTVDTFDMEDWEQQFQGNQVDAASLCILWQQWVHFVFCLIQCKSKRS
jgi:hypothetical protein